MLLKQREDTNWNGSLVVGVTTVSPSEVNFMDLMTSCDQGKWCLYSGGSVGEREGEKKDTETNLDKIPVGFH